MLLQEALVHYSNGKDARPEAVISSFSDWQDEHDTADQYGGWGCIPMRSYIRAVHGKANTLRKLQRHAEALEEYIELDAVESAWPRMSSSYVPWRYHMPMVLLACGRPRHLHHITS